MFRLGGEPKQLIFFSKQAKKCAKVEYLPVQGGIMSELVLRKDIQISGWDADMAAQVISYWSSRLFDIHEEPDGTIRGHRGSMWGNATSFDMRKVIADIRITHDPSGSCSCVLSINTILQVITPCNKAFFQLEMDAFESLVLHSVVPVQDWDALRIASRKEIAGYVIYPVLFTILSLSASHWLIRMFRHR